eukprot:8351105-Pyramimonas_sp.AAC.4
MYASFWSVRWRRRFQSYAQQMHSKPRSRARKAAFGLRDFSWGSTQTLKTRTLRLPTKPSYHWRVLFSHQLFTAGIHVRVPKKP